MLKATVLGAVATAREAIQDLLTEVPVTKRVAGAHVPGTPPAYVETTSDMKMTITHYTEFEIDGDRVRTTDLKAILFPIDGAVSVNDTLVFKSQKLRVHVNLPIMAGDAVVVNTLQLRPT